MWLRTSLENSVPFAAGGRSPLQGRRADGSHLYREHCLSLDKKGGCHGGVPLAWTPLQSDLRSPSLQVKSESGAEHTHRWVVYVRSPNNDDLTTIVSKVVFHLHSSFADPDREALGPVFEVSEHGWGEFELKIEVGTACHWLEEGRHSGPAPAR